MKLIDVFCYNGEPILELRLEYLADVVDEFVLVESRFTFSGTRKASFYSDALPARPNVTVLKIEDAPEKADEEWARQQGGSASSAYMAGAIDCWYREKVQRDFPRDYVMNKYSGTDYVVVCGDVDEIPHKSVLTAVKTQCYGRLHEPVHLHMAMCMYNFEWQTDEVWTRAYVMNSAGLEAYPSMDALRRSVPQRVAPNGGWHCSYFLSNSDLARKLRAFSHQEFNKPEFTDDAHIRRCVREGKDVLKRGGIKRFAGKTSMPASFGAFNEKMLFLQRHS